MDNWYNKNSIAGDDPDRHVWAEKAELLVMDLLSNVSECDRVSANNSATLYDIDAGGLRVDVKTKRRNFDAQGCWTCAVPASQINHSCDIYVFCNSNTKTGETKIVGWDWQEIYKNTARFVNKGEFYDNKTQLTDAYIKKISDLTNIGELIKMITGNGWLVSNKEQANNFCEFIMDQAEKANVISYSVKKETRTSAQNAALHSCFRRLADELNDAGFGIPHPFKKELEIPWTEISAKELLYKPIIRSLYDTDTTTKLTSEQLSKSASLLLIRIGELTGVQIGLTSQETALLNAR
tara:strand:+ start:33 stop:914 length:882 start_codon:yes stop_codon:yes gene_type:complete